MAISQRLKYAPEDLASYVDTVKLFKDHPLVASHDEVLIPLRGGFMFSLLSLHLNHKPTLERTHFMPASEFLFEAGQVTRLFMKNYLVERLERYEREGRPLHILMIDEAKSGRAATNLYRRFQDVLENLKSTEAEVQAQEIMQTKPVLVRHYFDAIRENNERLLRARERDELRQLKAILKSHTTRRLRLVTENGDYTPEGAFLSRLLVRHGLMTPVVPENLLSHRLLVEQKLAAAVIGQFKGITQLPPEVQARTSANLSEPLEKPEDLARVFPALAPHLVRSHEQIDERRYIQFFPHVRLNPKTHGPHLAKRELYEAAFATLSNYRLRALLGALGTGRALSHRLELLRELSRHHRGMEESTFSSRVARLRGELYNHLKAGRPASEFPAERKAELTQLLKDSSRFNLVNLRVLTIHGVDNFITSLGYTKLKEAGAVSQLDTNKIITMDNPSTPVSYAEERAGENLVRKVYEASVAPTAEFRKVVGEAGLPRVEEHLGMFAQRVRRDTEAFIGRGRIKTTRRLREEPG